MISICVTAKDRAQLFVKCVQQLRASVDIPDAELIVADWGSKDYPLLQWLPDILTGSCITPTIVHIPRDQAFSRGRGLNVAAQWARHDVLFFIDTDMLIDTNVIHKGLDAVCTGAAYFPICYSYNDARRNKGRWRINGKGIVMLPRSTFIAAGCWDEFTQWGSEDQRFFDRVAELAPVIRVQTKGLYHQWHTPSMSSRTTTTHKPGKHTIS